MEILIPVIVLGTTIWVAADATALSNSTGGKYRVANQATWVWSAGCVLLWILFFPLYLASRAAFIRETQAH